jgi:hypothetical protein
MVRNACPQAGQIRLAVVPGLIMKKSSAGANKPRTGCAKNTTL